MPSNHVLSFWYHVQLSFAWYMTHFHLSTYMFHLSADIYFLFLFGSCYIFLFNLKLSIFFFPLSECSREALLYCLQSPCFMIQILKKKINVKFWDPWRFVYLIHLSSFSLPPLSCTHHICAHPLHTQGHSDTCILMHN